MAIASIATIGSLPASRSPRSAPAHARSNSNSNRNRNTSKNNNPSWIRGRRVVPLLALVLSPLATRSGNPDSFAAAMSTATNNNNNPSPTDAAARNTIDFLTIARGLKTTPRTGWIRQEAGPRIESVADHSWRISLMAMVAASCSSSSRCDGENYDYDSNRCIRMALVHDLAEATVGDITPHCGVSDDDKHARELAAMNELTQKLAPVSTTFDSRNNDSNSNDTIGAEILELWKEYEDGTTPEAKLVKDMDKLEMILQALEYETDGKNGKSLDGFFDSTRGKWRTPIGEAWGREIERRRRRQAEDRSATTTTTSTTTITSPEPSQS